MLGHSVAVRIHGEGRIASVYASRLCHKSYAIVVYNIHDDRRIRVYTMNLYSKKRSKCKKNTKGDMGGSLNNSSVSSSFQETAQVADQDFKPAQPFDEQSV